LAKFLDLDRRRVRSFYSLRCCSGEYYRSGNGEDLLYRKGKFEETKEDKFFMTNTQDKQHRAILKRIARRTMLERGLLPEFSLQAWGELDGIRGPATRAEESSHDLRNLIWCSIDNDDSRDLDQLTVAEAMPGGTAKILVAIADVDAVVKKQSALDDHARHNTTSVYTAAEIFPMLPEKLSTDLTSLNYESDRLAIVVEHDVQLRLHQDGDELTGGSSRQTITLLRANAV
jgi:exoribonuclease R